MRQRSIVLALSALSIAALGASVPLWRNLAFEDAAGGSRKSTAHSGGTGIAAAAVLPPAPKIVPGDGAPDELGRIPIVMYHSVGEPLTGHIAALSARMGLNISVATFNKQLETMWKAGWYPVNMRDALTARIDVPRGKTPVVLTFDDARRSQFRYLKNGQIDPNCVVGLLMAFHKRHPQDWPLRASFYVLPESQYNPVPFGQKGLETKKLRFLVANGFEVANHSTTHHPMRGMSAKQLEWEMSTCLRYVRARVPEATMDTMALPYGIAPRNKALWDVLLTDAPAASINRDAASDAALDSTYHNRCILLAGGNPSYAPIDRRFDRKQVMRVGVSPGELEGWIKALHRHGGPWHPYISDGDPETVTIPSSDTPHLDKARLDGTHLVVYNAATAEPAKKSSLKRVTVSDAVPKGKRRARSSAPSGVL